MLKSYGMSKKGLIRILVYVSFLLVIPFISSVDLFGESSYSTGAYGLAICGDSFCDSNESCSTCSADCGSCTTTGGGGGGGGGTLVYPTFYANQTQLDNGYEKSFKKHWSIKAEFQGINYTLTIEDLTTQIATINASSESATFTLSEGQNKNLDLNKDGFLDLKVSLENITGTFSYDANLILKILSQESSAEEQETPMEEITEISTKAKLRFWIVVAIISLLILLTSVIILIIKKKRDQQKYSYFKSKDKNPYSLENYKKKHPYYRI